MDDFRADLHCHSHCSDGSDAPTALLEKAVKVGLKGLSITDHDTIEAYTDSLFQKAKEVDLRLLPGVEMSSEWEGLPVHILGYGFDLNSLNFHAFLKEIQTRRIERNRAILKKLADRNMKIEEEELSHIGMHIIGRPHIAKLLVQKRYVSSTQQAFDLYLKDGGSCYVLGFKVTPKETILEIQKANGKAVLAHPHFYKKKHFVNELLDLPFDGIECYYGNLPENLEKPWLDLAKKKGWIATGGSDYHGSFKEIPLGASWVNEDTFNALLRRSSS
ncbi:MAG: PHP domain-containing protein [Chlamydiae bacterium]|nr:PHP domain-containing protein [Chlamydiota bacterium]